MSVLVTGAAGVIGQSVLKRLGNDAIGTDVVWYDRHLDVTDREEVEYWFKTVRPEAVIHLAAAKDAPEGEVTPYRTTKTNVDGTMNVVTGAGIVGAKVVLASTCKAADPETAYGASKLVAERIVLNAGGVVVRYYNVPETAGNVFRKWEVIPEEEPIPYTDCWRYFTSLWKVETLTTKALTYPSGRYAWHPRISRHMGDVARYLYPQRPLVEVPLRRGDRHREPLHAACEEMRPWKQVQTYFDGYDIVRIESRYDA